MYIVYIDDQKDQEYKTRKAAIRRAEGWGESYPELHITVQVGDNVVWENTDTYKGDR